MKFKQFKNISLVLSALMVFGFASCKKMNSLGFTPGTGTPVISSVRTLSKSIVDSMRVHSTTTYNSSGIATTTSYFDYTPQATAFDSTTVTGNLNNYYVLIGANLGSTTKIAINGVSVYFNRAFNSDKSVVFQIPTTVPYVQPQPNTIVVTTLNGSFTYKFTTLPPPPTITGVSDYDFQAGTQITLTGKGFASVSGIKLKATSDEVSIVSQNDSTLVMKMPAHSTATESTLLFTYTSGSNPAAQTASTTVFNDLDNGYIIFADNNFQNAWGDNSWAGPSGVSTTASHSGTASAAASYPAGQWKVEGWANWYPSFSYDAAYKYLTFWVKGGTVTHTLVLVGDKMAGGYGQIQNVSAYAAQLVTVPPNVWTFFKIPLASSQSSTNVNTLNYWANGSPAQQLGFFLQGMSGDVDEKMFFDEVAFIK
ncbi:hypothetical protein [uncultured Mucilaginibacter sp.]|uniref:hypothetical protein n=1 Tax=uncultured Mucilaginibacter sp. TaxID=797541 RepID=UPI0025CC12A9|nr:hypothetical protein [uncultured Mucilaginibacter sp.]